MQYNLRSTQVEKSKKEVCVFVYKWALLKSIFIQTPTFRNLSRASSRPGWTHYSQLSKLEIARFSIDFFPTFLVSWSFLGLMTIGSLVESKTSSDQNSVSFNFMAFSRIILRISNYFVRFVTNYVWTWNLIHLLSSRWECLPILKPVT